jgi:hypothetical protein
VFGRAILSRNESEVQCVAQTCLEKGRAEEQVYGECKGEGEEGNKWVEDILFVLQRGGSQERRLVSQSVVARSMAGLQVGKWCVMSEHIEL